MLRLKKLFCALIVFCSPLSCFAEEQSQNLDCRRLTTESLQHLVKKLDSSEKEKLALKCAGQAELLNELAANETNSERVKAFELSAAKVSLIAAYLTLY